MHLQAHLSTVFMRLVRGQFECIYFERCNKGSSYIYDECLVAHLEVSVDNIMLVDVTDALQDLIDAVAERQQTDTSVKSQHQDHQCYKKQAKQKVCGLKFNKGCFFLTREGKNIQKISIQKKYIFFSFLNRDYFQKLQMCLSLQ